MAASYRDLYTRLTRTITRFVDVFVKAELDCTATCAVSHGGEDYVVMWDGLNRPQDFYVLERNGDEGAHIKKWRDPAHPYRMAAVAVAIKPLYTEARRVVEENRKLLESAKSLLHEAMSTSPQPSDEPQAASDEPSVSPVSPESPH